MAQYGVTDQGFNVKPLTTIESEIDGDLQAILGASAGTEPDGSIPLDSMAGQLKTLMVDGFAAQWDLQQAVYSSRDPNQAGGASQDAICALNGVIRDAASTSTVTATCVGKSLTVLIPGRVATVTDTGARFLTTSQAIIAAATAWVGTTAYVPGDKRKNANNVYVCTVGGISAGAGGPTTQASAIVDGTVTWKFLGIGDGYVDVVFTADQPGPIGSLAGTLVTIGTPVSGWNAVINLLDAAVGALLESNTALRVRREQELAAAGNTIPDAIRANVLKVNQGSTDPLHAPPTACKVFFNALDVTNSDGLPPHSVEVLVQGGTDADIAQAIWDSIGAGTATHGTQTSTVTDSEGIPQIVQWTRPTAVPIWVVATLYYDAAQWPANSNTAVAQAGLSALLTYAESSPIALDVRLSALMGAIMRGPSSTNADGTARVPADAGAAAVKGLLEVSPLYFDIAAAPAQNATIVISARQIATFDSGRVTLTAITETP
jgi:uncharacterized phage protein gp47/JayE